MKRTSFTLFEDDEEDDHLLLHVPQKKQRKMGSNLTLFDDLLGHDHVLAPLPLNVFPAPVFLFGVCISSHNVVPEFQSHDIFPYSVSRQASAESYVCWGKKKQRSNRNQAAEPCPGPLPPRILRQIERDGGTVPAFLFQKSLTASDVKKQQNRLFLSRQENSVKKLMEFLTKPESSQVKREGDGLGVVTIDPKGEKYMLLLKYWPSMPMFVLKKQWSQLVKANELEEGDSIQLWGYRLDSEFRLAVNVKKAEKSRNFAGSVETSSSCGSSIISQAGVE